MDQTHCVRNTSEDNNKKTLQLSSGLRCLIIYRIVIKVSGDFDADIFRKKTICEVQSRSKRLLTYHEFTSGHTPESELLIYTAKKTALRSYQRCEGTKLSGT